MTLAEFRTAVSDELQRRYGITWDDTDGSDEPLERALEREESAATFVAWWGEKYYLTQLGKSAGSGA